MINLVSIFTSLMLLWQSTFKHITFIKIINTIISSCSYHWCLIHDSQVSNKPLLSLLIAIVTIITVFAIIFGISIASMTVFSYNLVWCESPASALYWFCYHHFMAFRDQTLWQIYVHMCISFNEYHHDYHNISSPHRDYLTKPLQEPWPAYPCRQDKRRGPESGRGDHGVPQSTRVFLGLQLYHVSPQQ